MSKKRELLYSITKKDLKIQTFTSGGPGGQHQNRRNTGVRIVHSESGAFGESREYKSQHQNKKAALKRLIEHTKFKLWHNRICHEIITGKTIEQIVDESLNEKNLKIEINENGKWKELINGKSDC